ncbi:MAG: DUF3142 domain-containing protein [Fimbriimonas sp.]
MPTDLPFDQMYVRAATLSFDGERLVPTLPQRFARGERRPVHLVFNFDGGATRHFGEMPIVTVSGVIAETYRSAKAAAKRTGLDVRGVQLDLDCPARLLPRYAELCRETKRLIGEDALSVTGLVSWLSEGSLSDLVASIDLFVPQFYEGRLPKTFREDVPVSDHASYSAVVEKLARLEKPYRAGIAAYGQALLFDPTGKLVSTYRGLSVADAFRHPSLRLDSIRDVKGERHVRFLATRADRLGRGLGYGILFRIPTAKSLQAALQAVRTNRPRNCEGAAIFRVAEANEAATLPLVTIASVLRDEEPRAEIEKDSTSRPNPYALIEGSAKEAAEDVRVALRNVGDAPRLETEPVRVDVRFGTGCADVVSVAHADRMTPLDANGQPARGSLRRASGVRFERMYVGAGERVELGKVRLKPGCVARVDTASK